MQNVSPARNQINPEKLSLGIIIPAYQVRTEILEELIRRIRQSCRNYQMKIIIIDDGSDPPLLDQLQLPENILLYRHDKNLGKGMALQTGFRELLKSHSPDVIITIDSDLQH
ncbi:MAG: glycosyltransferase, partial [Calditrichaeota bacterium]